jgi:hypothetical protein
VTDREAAIISAYTGVLIGSVSTLHVYVEEIMERPVWTHEMGSKDIAAEIKRRSKADFLAISVTVTSAELNALRKAIRRNVEARMSTRGYWSRDGRSFTGYGGYLQADLDAQIERELLTAVSLGQAAEDIEADAERIIQAYFEEGQRRRYSMLRLGGLMLTTEQKRSAVAADWQRVR